MTKLAPYHGAAATQRALAAVGQSYPPGWCQKFTNEIFQSGAVGDYDGDGDADANDGWEKAVAHGKVVNASAIRSHKDIPAATMLYFSGGRFGHAAVSVGGGYMVSTDLPTTGRIGKVPIEMATQRWGYPLRGYVTVEGNGYTLTDATSPTKPPTTPPKTGVDGMTAKDIAKAVLYTDGLVPAPATRKTKTNAFWNAGSFLPLLVEITDHTKTAVLSVFKLKVPVSSLLAKENPKLKELAAGTMLAATHGHAYFAHKYSKELLDLEQENNALLKQILAEVKK